MFFIHYPSLQLLNKDECDCNDNSLSNITSTLRIKYHPLNPNDPEFTGELTGFLESIRSISFHSEHFFLLYLPCNVLL